MNSYDSNPALDQLVGQNHDPQLRAFAAKCYHWRDEEVADLRHQLAEREAQMERLRRAVEANHKWHLNHDDYDGYGESELCEINHKAMSESHSTALASFASLGRGAIPNAAEQILAERALTRAFNAGWWAGVNLRNSDFTDLEIADKRTRVLRMFLAGQSKQARNSFL
jgi:hypothetical protein